MSITFKTPVDVEIDADDLIDKLVTSEIKELCEHIKVSDFVAVRDVEEILNEIGKEAAMRHFGLVESEE